MEVRPWNRTGNVAVGSRQTEAWAYDNAGNQTSVTRDGTADARTYNDDNELVSTTEGNTKRDAKGNITKDAEGNKYFYDLDNRIFRIKMKNGAKIRFAYDALSRRVFRKKGSDKKAFLWWGDQETSEHVSGAGQPVIQNDLWAHPTALNKIVARAVEGKKTDIQYYHKNYLDHVYAVSDKDGDIKEHYRYTAFGEAEIYNTQGQKLAESAIDNDVLWNSRRFDGETGLYYYKYRHYTAKLGRWLGRDPIEEDGGVNLYGFVGNDVLNKWDRLGEAVPVILAGGAALTAAQAVATAFGVSLITCMLMDDCRAAAVQAVEEVLGEGVDAAAALLEYVRCEAIREACILKCAVGRCFGGNFDNCFRNCLEDADCWGIQH